MSLNHTPITDELADYVRRVTLREPEVLRRLREEAEGYPDGPMLQIGPEQGQFLHLLARILGARKTLEVGVFIGYSSTWVALALPPGGKVVACDRSAEYVARARRTWREAGVEDKIEPRLAPAIETLDALVAEGQAGTFDDPTCRWVRLENEADIHRRSTYAYRRCWESWRGTNRPWPGSPVYAPPPMICLPREKTVSTCPLIRRPS